MLLIPECQDLPVSKFTGVDVQLGPPLPKDHWVPLPFSSGEGFTLCIYLENRPVGSFEASPHFPPLFCSEFSCFFTWDNSLGIIPSLEVAELGDAEVIH